MNRNRWILPPFPTTLLGGLLLVTLACRGNHDTQLELSGNIEVVQMEASFRVAGKVDRKSVV